MLLSCSTAPQLWRSRQSVPDKHGSGIGRRRVWFPYKDEFRLCWMMPSATSKVVIDWLGGSLDDQLKKRFTRVVANRTYSICFVAQALDDLGNITQLLRCADAFGFQSVHLITSLTIKRYKGARRTQRGVERWLDVEFWDSTSACIAELKTRGYQIAVTTLSENAVSICDMDWTIPTAVLFGNEQDGASELSVSEADVQCGIPMLGMVESLNVSVAGGIVMQNAVNDRMTRRGHHGDLLPHQQQILTAEFYMRSKRANSDNIFSQLIKKRQLDQYRSF